VNVEQFAHFVVRPTLRHLGLYSLAAERLLLGTVAQESRFVYIDQLDRGDRRLGPGLGLYQVEGRTHDDHLRWLEQEPDLQQKVLALRASTPSAWEQMVSNLAYATAIARIHYWRVPQALPHADDIEGMAHYWKKYYNTRFGKGTPAQFMLNYTHLVRGYDAK